MRIRTVELGYRELSRMADFIREIENGNEVLQEIIENFDDVIIKYNIHADRVEVDCFLDDTPITSYTDSEILGKDEEE